VTTEMRRRAIAVPAASLLARHDAWPVSRPQPAGGDGVAARGDADNRPVIILSYAYSGADLVQRAIAAGTDLACTSGTGIIPLCAAAAETWRRVDDRSTHALSPLAAASIRSMVAAQVTAILAAAGKTRWCELATASPGAAESFARVLPRAVFICVHRSCLGVVQAAVQVNPWGLHGQGLMPYVLAYPGNSVAAMAAYWADSAEQLIAFEEANRETTQRVRYEDVTTDPDQAIAPVRTTLHLNGPAPNAMLPAPPGHPDPGASPPTAEAAAPAGMVPGPLRQRIDCLHAKLGYPLLDP
jgi:hypothetical protein